MTSVAEVINIVDWKHDLLGTVAVVIRKYEQPVGYLHINTPQHSFLFSFVIYFFITVFESKLVVIS